MVNGFHQDGSNDFHCKIVRSTIRSWLQVYGEDLFVTPEVESAYSSDDNGYSDLFEASLREAVEVLIEKSLGTEGPFQRRIARKTAVIESLGRLCKRVSELERSEEMRTLFTELIQELIQELRDALPR